MPRSTNPRPRGGKSLKIKINGQQFVCGASSIRTRPFAYNTMVVPVDTTVTLDINSQDVDHSWWIPKLGPKFDAVPGYTNHSWFQDPGQARFPKGKERRDVPRPSAPSCAATGTRTWWLFVRAGAAGPATSSGVAAARSAKIDQANADAVKQRSQFNPIPSQ